MTNKTDDFEKKLHAFSRQTFNTQSNALDENVLQRLKQAREMALLKLDAVTQIQKNKPSEIRFPTWFAPVSTAAAFASISIISISLIFQTETQHLLTEENTASPFDDIALLSSHDEFELYEDIDFYIWLESTELHSNEEINKKIEHDKSAG